MDLDNQQGFGPERYVLSNTLTPDSPVYGDFQVWVHGNDMFDDDGTKEVGFELTARRHGEVGLLTRIA